MAPRLSWSKVIPGLIALTVIIAIALGVVVFGGVSRVHGEKMRLYVATDQARGVMRGTDVWLAGQRIGVVEEIAFAPPTSDTSARVVITIDVTKDDAEQIRRDSEVQVRAGANIVGPIVVYVTAGTAGSPAVSDGDTLRARAQNDLQGAAAKLEPVMREFGLLMDDARAAMALVRSPNGSIGAALAERDAIVGNVGRLRIQVSRLGRLSGDDRTSGLGGLMASARSALARADSIRTLLTSARSSFGRFRRDSTLGLAVASVRDELAQLRSTLQQTDGTLGRFSSDSAVTVSIANAQREMTLLFDDIRRRPLRYLAF